MVEISHIPAPLKYGIELCIINSDLYAYIPTDVFSPSPISIIFFERNNSNLFVVLSICIFPFYCIVLIVLNN